MPRPKSLDPSVRIHVFLTQANAAALALATYSEELGKPAFGAQSAIINEALRLYFRKDPACTPSKPTLESPSSAQSPRSGP